MAAGPLPLQTREGQHSEASSSGRALMVSLPGSAELLSGDTCWPSGLLELRRCCWPPCPGEVRGGQSLAQNTKGELGGLLVERWH